MSDLRTCIKDINKAFAAEGPNAAIVLATKLELGWIAKKIDLGEWVLSKPKKPYFLHETIDRYRDKELIRVCTPTGVLEQYVIRWSEGDPTTSLGADVRMCTQPLGKVSLHEAQKRLGKVHMPVSYGARLPRKKKAA
jgi:hypothetical protein